MSLDIDASSTGPVTLHVIKKPLIFDELNTIFGADSQPALVAWTILLHASTEHGDLPLDMIFKETGMKVQDKRGQWNFHPVVGDRRLLKVTGVGALSGETSSSMKLICPLRDALDVRLTALQRTELNLPPHVQVIPLSTFTPLMCKYMRRKTSRAELFDNLILDQAAPLVFELKESERFMRVPSSDLSCSAERENIIYWRFNLPRESVPVLQMVRNRKSEALGSSASFSV